MCSILLTFTLLKMKISKGFSYGQTPKSRAHYLMGKWLIQGFLCLISATAEKFCTVNSTTSTIHLDSQKLGPNCQSLLLTNTFRPIVRSSSGTTQRLFSSWQIAVISSPDSTRSLRYPRYQNACCCFRHQGWSILPLTLLVRR